MLAQAVYQLRTLITAKKLSASVPHAATLRMQIQARSIIVLQKLL